jgi:16S rRNA (guanine527-N7)-methyltransferase
VDKDREPLPTRVQGLPELPPEALTLLKAGLLAIRLGDLSEAIRQGLVDHLRLLLAWNQAINLTAIRDPQAAVREHILDSLCAVELLQERGIDSFLDLGSGGGYPGLPLALVLQARRCLLVESVAKKAAFLSVAGAQALETSESNGTIDVFIGRAESLAADPRHRERWPAVVARAVAPLAELAEIALPLVAPAGLLVAWKRQPIEAELGAAAAAVGRLGGSPARVVPVAVAGLEDHVLVVIDKVGRSPAGYPRDPGRRRNRPIQAGDRLPSA